MGQLTVIAASNVLTVLGIVGITVVAVAVVTAPFILLAGGKPRVKLATAGDRLMVELGRRDGAFAFKRRLEIPLADIAAVTTAAPKSVRTRAVRLPGTEIPGVIRAGSFGRKPKREFWDVRRGDTVLVIDTTSADPYTRLVLEVEDPAGKAAWLQSELGLGA